MICPVFCWQCTSDESVNFCSVIMVLFSSRWWSSSSGRMSCSDCGLPQCRSWGKSIFFIVNTWCLLVARVWVDWEVDEWISHQWYVQLDSVLAVVPNDVPVNACNDTYVSSSYVCLESVFFCLWSYLVRHGIFVVSFQNGQCYLFLRYLCVLFSLCSCILYSRISYVHLFGVGLWDQHVVIRSSAR